MSQERTRPQLLTVGEVAAMLRVSTMTVYRLVQSGELRALKIGKSYRLRDDDVETYLAGQYTAAG